MGFRKQSHFLYLMGLFYFCIGQLFSDSKQPQVLRGLEKSGFVFPFCYLLVVDQLLFCSTYLHSELKESTFRSYYSLGKGKRAMVELQDGFQSFCIEVVIVTSAHI